MNGRRGCFRYDTDMHAGKVHLIVSHDDILLQSMLWGEFSQQMDPCQNLDAIYMHHCDAVVLVCELYMHRVLCPSNMPLLSSCTYDIQFRISVLEYLHLPGSPWGPLIVRDCSSSYHISMHLTSYQS